VVIGVVHAIHSSSAASITQVDQFTDGLYLLQELRSRADPQDMTSNDEPIYETVKREHNWDPERCEPLRLTTSVGRHLG
jgi:hypothetical protein